MKRLLPPFIIHSLRRILPMLVLLTTLNTLAFAQDCGCDFVINPPEDPTVSVFINGETMGVQPGQTICLQAGFYKQVRLVKITGAPGQPVTVKNCGGLVQIGDDVNFGRWYAVDIVTCNYMRFTGSTDPGIRYGIKLGRSGDSGLKIGQLSSDTEIDHIEIANPNFAGILAKTDFGANPPPDAPEMNNVNIHDNYIHDTRGEGMYIGETKSPGQNFRHLEVWNNIITRTGLDLIQVANVVEDIQVHHNVFYAAGLRNVLYQNKGFQIGDNSVGKYYNNFIIGSPSNSMIVMGSGNIEISNNYMEGAGDPAFFVDNRPFSLPETPISIHQNYIMEVNETFPIFNVFNERNPISITENIIEGNNVLMGYGSGAGPNITESGNAFGAIERVQFVDTATDNFALVAGSPYQDLGLMSDVSGRNNRPYVALIPDAMLDFETTLEIPVSAGDSDGDALTLEAFNLPSFVSFVDMGNGKGLFTLAPQEGEEGVYYKLRVRVTDSKGSMNTQNFHITVLDPYAFLASASSFQENLLPENTLDEDLTSRWAPSEGSGNWIRYDLREDKLVTSLQIAFYNGSTTVYPFTVEVSEDDINWHEVFSGSNSGASTELERFEFGEVRARYLRIRENGAILNSYNEVVINCITAPQYATVLASDDIYKDGKKVVNNEVLKAKEPKVTSYLRFSVSGVDVDKAPVISATLKLTAVEDGFGRLVLALGNDTDWNESSPQSTLPERIMMLDTLDSQFISGQVYEFNVSGAVGDNGVYNFIVSVEGSRGGLIFSSTEGQFAPELVVETLRGAEVQPVQIVAPSTGRIGGYESNHAGGHAPSRIFPNPVESENVTLWLGSEGASSVSVEIFDRLGKPFFSGQWVNADERVELDLSSSDMDPGMYILKVKREDGPLEILRMFKR